MYAGQISGLVAGENILAGDFTFIAAGTGRLMKTTGAAGQIVAGAAPRDANTNEPLTVYNINCRVGYATALTPGQKLYLSATAGRLGDAPAVAGDPPVAIAVNATDIFITRAG
jgi:hypothetical protein